MNRASRNPLVKMGFSSLHRLICELALFFLRSIPNSWMAMKNGITGKVSTSIQASASRVWQALTKPDMIKQYYFGTETITDWKEGSPIMFRGEWNGKHYEDKGTVLDVEPFALLRYSYWSSLSGREDKPENYVPVTYALTDMNNKTILTVTQENIPTEKMKESTEKNWKKILRNLKKLLEG